MASVIESDASPVEPECSVIEQDAAMVEPDCIVSEQDAVMVEPDCVVAGRWLDLFAPHLREFLPASIPGVTVCRPWAAIHATYPVTLVLPAVIPFRLYPYPEGPFPRIPASGFLQEQPEGYDPAAILRRAAK